MKNLVYIFILLMLYVPTGYGDAPTGTIPEALSSEDVVNETHAYSTYRTIQKALQQGTDPATIKYLGLFLSKDDLGDSAEETLKIFTNTVFNSNVLYSFLEESYKPASLKKDDGTLLWKNTPWKSYNLGWASVIAYQQTQEKRFIEQYIEYFEKVMQHRDSVLGLYDDYHGRVMDAWGFKNKEGKWLSHVTHFAIIMGPATAVALLIKTDPRLVAYSAFGDEILTFFKPAYREFDVDLRPAGQTGEQWYWRPFKNKFEATNHLHVQGETLLNMYALTGDEFYAERIRWIIRVFEKGVTIDNKGFVAWNYFPYLQVESAMTDHSAVYYSELVWKAGYTIPFLYKADAAGFKINRAILNSTTKTIRDHILANNGLSSHLNPRESAPIEIDPATRDRGKQGAIVMFLAAAGKDPIISQRILTIVSSRQDIYAAGWLSKGMARMAKGYAYFLNRKSRLSTASDSSVNKVE